MSATVRQKEAFAERLDRIGERVRDVEAFEDWLGELDPDQHINLLHSSTCLGAQWYTHVARCEGMDVTDISYGTVDGRIEVVDLEVGPNLMAERFFNAGPVGTRIRHLIHEMPNRFLDGGVPVSWIREEYERFVEDEQEA